MSTSKGFTLLELLVALFIAIIIMTIAVPSFSRLINTTTMTSSVNTFMSDMRFARSEAVRRNGGVVMCRSANPEAIDASCAAGTLAGWESGWIIFHDLDNDGDRAVGEPLLRAQLPSNFINSISEPGASTVFKFTATGRLGATSATQLQFGKLPEFDSLVQRMVCVNMSGRVRIALDGNGRATGDALCSTDR